MENPIRVWLVQNRRSAAWLAREIGMIPHSVIHWLQGVTFPRDSSFERMAKVIGRDIRPEYLQWYNEKKGVKP